VLGGGLEIRDHDHAEHGARDRALRFHLIAQRHDHSRRLRHHDDAQHERVAMASPCDMCCMNGSRPRAK
jgi:hypothetical protein